MKRLNDIFPTFNDFKGLLASIQTAFGVDNDNNPLLWSDKDGSDLELLDFDFYEERKTKIITTLLESFYDENAMTGLPSLVALRFGANWKEVYDAYFLTDYKPLENYAMKEERVPDLEEKIDTDANSKTESKTSTSVYGFNSEEASPASDADNTTEGLKVNNFGSSTKTNKGKETLTRSGNIGVTTSQQMLQSEIQLREFDYWKMVFDELDKLLCRGIY